MSYCINPDCPHPKNSDSLENCHACKSRLIYDGIYRVTEHLKNQEYRLENREKDTRLYEAIDLKYDVDNSKVLKVLITKGDRQLKRLNQEAKILMQLSHLGIPKCDGFFPFETSNGTRLHCLAMEKIEGQNLEEWLQENGAISEDLALNWMEQLVEILYAVHQKKFLHQDIKPSNIMRQPDDRLVLIDFSNVPGIVSPGYTPPEQADDKAVEQSDFFALGRTFVHLLTGKHPLDLPKDTHTNKLVWRNKARKISSEFADLIDDLMAVLPRHRPQSARDILARLNKITHDRSLDRIDSSKSKVLNLNKLLIGTSIIALSGWIVAFKGWSKPSSIPIKSLDALPVCSLEQEDSISCGEETLFPGSPIDAKERGIDAFRNGKYNRAIELFKKARTDNPEDAETLIYLNNAQLDQNKVEVYTIAIVLPITATPTSVKLSQQALRGVAQAQTEINREKINGKGLRVIIADDGSNETQAKQIANSLSKRTDILGVLGHYASEITLAALPIYERHDLVLISYGSTSTDLSNKSQFFFRTVPTTTLTAETLNSYLNKRERVAVFYNPKSSFSRSLTDEFDRNINVNRGKIVEKIDLCSQVEFDAVEVLKKVKKAKATAIALFPDGYSCKLSLPNAFSIIKANNRDRTIAIGSWSLALSDTLQNLGEHLVGKLVVAGIWHRLGEQTNQNFVREAEKLWGQKSIYNDGVNAISAMSYDATMALKTALKNIPKPNRVNLQQELAKPNFIAEGATGTVSFNGGDRQEHIHQLLTVVKSKNCNSYGYSFIPVDRTAVESGEYDCKKP
jgi:eukaryotic-like serine/threonine-protein kinase